MRGSIQLLKDSYTTFAQNVGLFIGISVVPTAIGFVASMYSGTLTGDVEMMMSPVSLVLLLISIIASMLMWIALSKAISSPSTVTVGEAYLFAKQNLLSYTWVSILLCLIIMVGFILLVIPGIIFALWYGLATYVVLFENKRGFDALKRSKELVDGRLGELAIRVIFIMVLSTVITLVATGLAPWMGESDELIYSQLTVMAVNLVTYPIMMTFMYYIYVDLQQVGTTTSSAEVSTSNETQADTQNPTQN